MPDQRMSPLYAHMVRREVGPKVLLSEAEIITSFSIPLANGVHPLPQVYGGGLAAHPYAVPKWRADRYVEETWEWLRPRVQHIVASVMGGG